MPEKPFGGIIESWCIHEIVLPQVEQDASVRFLTGSVVEDCLRRWKPGDSMRSSEIVNFDKGALLVETINTLYALRGPGRFSSRLPILYHNEVYRTEMLIADKGHLLDDGIGNDQLYYPEDLK